MRSTVVRIIRLSLIASWGVIALPLGLLAVLEKYLSGSKSLFLFGAQSVAAIPGFPGKYVRTAFYMMALESFHHTAILSYGSYFCARESRMGSRSGAGEYCIFGKVDIGARCRIASRVSIVSGLHEHGSTATIGEIHRGGAEKMVTVGTEVWIGEAATIAADLGDSSVVGLGSVVVNPVPVRGFVMGNPARLLPPTVKPIDSDSSK